ncbi:hypothetical protein Clacol_004232 [Clathrus columnatus]|uniref:Cupin type-1 domain-containing protein n=1 Tax=Clathrus columnatus TaxID=1419009 RepID=A0AAV5A5T6_9AGAM|nr:hypothetical protein Clacol_004232 [Clathrus columnatus]
MIHSRILIVAFILLQQQFTFAAPAPVSSVSIASDVSAAPAPPHSTSTPTKTSTSTAATSSFTAGLTSDDPNDSFINEFQNETPEAIRGSLGATVIGPQNIDLDRQSADFLAPPSTDAGSVPNAKWPFSLSHNRLQTGGWARQQNGKRSLLHIPHKYRSKDDFPKKVGTMPIATQIAGVNMRPLPIDSRELHWHSIGEWGYVLKGTARITAMTAEGNNYEADIETTFNRPSQNQGDVWYFPAGVPHSIQGMDTIADGTEFLLVFDSGDFSEDDTFLLSDWLAHTPKEVLAKNFKTSIQAFDNIPANQLYIFPGTVPPSVDKDEVSDPQGHANPALSVAWSQSARTSLPGGSVKVLDSTNFPISKTIAAADVMVEPGHMREMHWHPIQDEWSYFMYANVFLNRVGSL